jgi:2-oxoisovalerate dehydrogenase E1 component alpha subunit
MAICGEGATSSGDWYEAVNWAAVQKLPVVFFIENNQYAISSRVEQQMAVRNVADKARGLGLPGYIVDGMDVFAVQHEVSRAVEGARRGGGPSLVEAKVYRLTPHSSDDDDRFYRSREEVLEYKAQDPLEIARQRMENANVINRLELKQMDNRAAELVNQAVEFAQKAIYPIPESGGERLFAGKANHA